MITIEYRTCDAGHEVGLFTDGRSAWALTDTGETVETWREGLAVRARCPYMVDRLGKEVEPCHEEVAFTGDGAAEVMREDVRATFDVAAVPILMDRP